MSIPNQTAIASSKIFTSRSPGGTPPPASQAGNGDNNKTLNVPVASTGQPFTPAVTSFAQTSVPGTQEVGEYVSSSADIFIRLGYIAAIVSVDSPTAGVSPTPLPSVLKFSGPQPSDGQQPAVDSPFTGSGWSD